MWMWRYSREHVLSFSQCRHTVDSALLSLWWRRPNHIARLCKNSIQASFTENRRYDVTLKEEVAVHAVNMKMSGNSFASCYECLSNNLTTKHSLCVWLPQIAASKTPTNHLWASTTLFRYATWIWIFAELQCAISHKILSTKIMSCKFHQH